MIRQLKTFTVNVVAGANVAVGVAMVLVGFTDYADPTHHPYIATAGLLFPLFLLANLGFLAFWLFFKRRMALIPIAAYAAAFAPIRVYLPINHRADPPEGSIKVLSYNVRGYASSPEHGNAVGEIVDYIRNSGADIVCLQEDLQGGRDVKARLDSAFAHSDTTHIMDGTRLANTLGIYTRYPILRKERIRYPAKGNGSVAYYLKVGGDTVLVVNNHFESTGLSPDDRAKYKEILKGEVAQDTAREESKRLLHKLGDAAARRAPQADSVRKYVAEHSRYPTILCGDFNDSPISYTRRVLAEELTDCYVATGRGIGLSYNQKGFFVRIDNMMCSGSFEPYKCTVDDKIAASDHYPIYCWLKMQ